MYFYNCDAHKLFTNLSNVSQKKQKIVDIQQIFEERYLKMGLFLADFCLLGVFKLLLRYIKR